MGKPSKDDMAAMRAAVVQAAKDGDLEMANKIMKIGKAIEKAEEEAEQDD